MRFQVFVPLLAALCLPSAALADEGQHQHQHGDAETLGTVDFPVSCAPAAQAEFGRAAALLHSFWYDEAEKAFTEVARLDPECVMGYWGVAMSNFHPLWAPPMPAELARGTAAVGKAKAKPAPTARERDFIAGIDAYYRDAATVDHATRKGRFAAAMEQMHLAYPKDREAAIFYALALLGTAPPTDKTYANQRKAAEILNRLLPEAPQHPGIAHYVIHSFDYPQLAELALPAARAYSTIAASSPHALHMPSHIFTRLGLWDDSIRSNTASAELASRHLQKDSPGATAFDELHALDYLEYAYLQEARGGQAREVLDRVRAAQRFDVLNFQVAYALAAVPARHALERRQWKEAAALVVTPAGFPWAQYPYAEAITHFARAIGGARGGDLAAARGGRARLAEIRSALSGAKDSYDWGGQVEIQRLAADAWIALAERREGEALKLMRASADLEDSTEKHPVTPGAVLPARELLADMLLEAGQAAPALQEYEASLRTAPGRFNSLAGGVKAALAAGQTAKARQLYAMLEALSAHSDGSRPELKALRPSPAAGS